MIGVLPLDLHEEEMIWEYLFLVCFVISQDKSRHLYHNIACTISWHAVITNRILQIIRKSKEREKKNTCNEVKSKKFSLVVCKSVVNLSFSLLSLSIVFFRFALKVFM